MPIGGYAVKSTILTSAARTETGQSSGYNVGEFGRIVFYLDVTAVSGSGATMVAKIQESPDNSEWYDTGVEETITGADNY